MIFFFLVLQVLDPISWFRERGGKSNNNNNDNDNDNDNDSKVIGKLLLRMELFEITLAGLKMKK